MARFIIILLLTFCNSVLFSQSDRNLKKYWRYKERMKNYIVVGDCQGCSLPSSNREFYFDYIDDDPTKGINNGHLNYPDEVIELGHYIGVLASEYALLLQHGEFDQSKKTKEELWYALEAINRLDQKAEYWWRYYYKNDGPAANEFFADLNGFFIRDDVPEDFVNKYAPDGNLIENHLNSSYFPSDDGRVAEVVGSSFTAAVFETGAGFDFPCNFENGKQVGPREESLDQVVQLMVGLAMCARYIPPGAIVIDDVSGLPKQFETGTGVADILSEVKIIAERITRWIEINQWIIKNPITLNCVKATFWPKDAEPGDGCKCIAGGADFQFFSYGLAMLNSRIQVAPLMFSDGATNAYFSARYGSDPIILTSSALWLSPIGFKSVPIGKEDQKVLSLAAAAHIWGNETGPILQTRCAKEFFSTQEPGDRLHLPLLHQALYGIIQPSYPPDFYTCMLDKAQCLGPHGNDGNEIWSQSQSIIMYGYNNHNYSAENNGIGYMYYFNLYNIVYPTYLFASDYKYIAPFDLCEDDIVKTGFTYNDNSLFVESDQKTFIASNSITAMGGDPTNPDPASQKPYVIDNDDDPQSAPLSIANITYMAKGFVHLMPGFEVHQGAEFRASINTSLNSMLCSVPTAASASECEDYLIPFRSASSPSEDQVNELLNDARNELAQNNQDTIRTNEIHNINNTTIIPNPNNGSFQISITRNDKPIAIKEIKVYDIMGKVIWENGPSTNSIFNIDITAYAGGIYYVKCINEFDEVEMKKLIKQ